jgi:hypothetical protein
MRGYKVLESRALFDDPEISIITASSFKPIFNGIDSAGRLTYDGLRRQATGRWSRHARRLLTTILDEAGALECPGGTKSVTDLAALDTLEGCGFQPWHADAAPPDAHCQQDVRNVPLSVLVALYDDTKIELIPLDSNDQVEVTLARGSILIFRGDLLHRGFEYVQSPNVRLHLHIDSDVAGCKRRKGQTFIATETYGGFYKVRND